MSTPAIGVSACLLGRPVRYNGGHKRQDWLVDELGRFVEWYPVCPEMEMGLGTPRESVRLIDTPEGVRMVGHESARDLTELARTTAASIVSRLPTLDGFVLKKDSPSCGKERVKIYSDKGMPLKKGAGLFAERLLETHPDLPIIEEGRLGDPEQREHFVTRVFARHRFRSVPETVVGVQEFHRAHKFLILGHSPAIYARLGQIAANLEGKSAVEARAEYGKLLGEALSVPASRNRRVNVLQHLAGFFKLQLDRRERQEVFSSIHDYERGEVPLLVPVSLIHYLVRKFEVQYLADQIFFEPVPKELAIRRWL